MNIKNILKYSILNAFGAAAYVGVVAIFMNNAEKSFEPVGPLGAMMFLLVFVISAAAMGLIVFGRPAMWFLDGSRREAAYLAIGTVGILIAIAVLVFISLLLIA